MHNITQNTRHLRPATQAALTCAVMVFRTNKTDKRTSLAITRNSLCAADNRRLHSDNYLPSTITLTDKYPLG